MGERDVDAQGWLNILYSKINQTIEQHKSIGFTENDKKEVLTWIGTNDWIEMAISMAPDPYLAYIKFISDKLAKD